VDRVTYQTVTERQGVFPDFAKRLVLLIPNDPDHVETENLDGEIPAALRHGVFEKDYRTLPVLLSVR